MILEYIEFIFYFRTMWCHEPVDRCRTGKAGPTSRPINQIEHSLAFGAGYVPQFDARTSSCSRTTKRNWSSSADGNARTWWTIFVRPRSCTCWSYEVSVSSRTHSAACVIAGVCQSTTGGLWPATTHWRSSSIHALRGNGSPSFEFCPTLPGSTELLKQSMGRLFRVLRQRWNI